MQDDHAAIADDSRVRSLLIRAAINAESLTYGGLLAELGVRFSRPKMRALCATLDRIGETSRANGEPDLAVLVVRKADGMPGSGWWATNAPYQGEGISSHSDTAALTVASLQKSAHDYWAYRTNESA